MTDTQFKYFNILHFNDVYNVEGQKIEPLAGAARFRTALRAHGAGEESCIVLFSGDAFSPSLISSTTQGKHMPTILNDMFVDCAVVGNHDLDFGLDIMCECLRESRFPWLDANVMERDTNQPLLGTKSWHIIERIGLRIGLIGLLEAEWIATLSCVDATDLLVLDACETGRQCATDLKTLDSYQCDLVIALTHMRWPNDRNLAKSVPVIDLILGGHDHDYKVEYLDKLGQAHHTKAIVKSGSDFRTFSKIRIKLDTVRKRIVDLIVDEVIVDSRWDEDKKVLKYVTSLTEKMEKRLNLVIGRIEVPLDCRFSSIRTKETNIGNLFCDIILTAIAADLAIINSGAFRADRIINAGEFRLRDLMNILPILDPLVVLQVTGKLILQALENGVSKYPKHEGRFPSVAGARFSFDPSQTAGKRVARKNVTVQGQPLQLNRKYRLCVTSYMAGGRDGYDVLKNCAVLIDEENGPIFNTVVQNYFRTIQVLNSFERPITRSRQRSVSIPKLQRLTEMTVATKPLPPDGKSLTRWQLLREIFMEKGKLKYVNRVAPTLDGRISVL